MIAPMNNMTTTWPCNDPSVHLSEKLKHMIAQNAISRRKGRERHKSNPATLTAQEEILAGKLSTNQRPAFGAKSLEHDGKLITSERHLHEFTVSIWKQCNEQLLT